MIWDAQLLPKAFLVLDPDAGRGWEHWQPPPWTATSTPETVRSLPKMAMLKVKACKKCLGPEQLNPDGIPPQEDPKTGPPTFRTSPYCNLALPHSFLRESFKRGPACERCGLPPGRHRKPLVKARRAARRATLLRTSRATLLQMNMEAGKGPL